MPPAVTDSVRGLYLELRAAILELEAERLRARRAQRRRTPNPSSVTVPLSTFTLKR